MVGSHLCTHGTDDHYHVHPIHELIERRTDAGLRMIAGQPHIPPDAHLEPVLEKHRRLPLDLVQQLAEAEKRAVGQDADRHRCPLLGGGRRGDRANPECSQHRKQETGSQRMFSGQANSHEASG